MHCHLTARAQTKFPANIRGNILVTRQGKHLQSLYTILLLYCMHATRLYTYLAYCTGGYRGTRLYRRRCCTYRTPAARAGRTLLYLETRTNIHRSLAYVLYRWTQKEHQENQIDLVSNGTKQTYHQNIPIDLSSN